MQASGGNIPVTNLFVHCPLTIFSREGVVIGVREAHRESRSAEPERSRTTD